MPCVLDPPQVKSSVFRKLRPKGDRMFFKKFTRSLFGGVGIVALVVSGSNAQLAPLCWVTVPTTGCELCEQPLSVICPNGKTCHHRIISNESGTRAVGTSVGYSKRIGIVSFLLCEIRLKACTFNLCAETGQVFALSCEPSIAAGASCP